MSGHEQPNISVLVPARNEEQTLPTTLPAIIKAARELPQPAEVLVITPPDSQTLVKPPVHDPIVRWLPTPRPGKFEALRVGAHVANGNTLLLVDADVVTEPDTFRILARPILDGSADVVAGRIDLLPSATSGPEQLLERWALLSFRTWHELRSGHPDLLWALPGAIYGIRRDLFPATALVPVVDDASLGLRVNDLGATFTYAPGATVYTPAPATWQGWVRQKLRSRRGWAALARLRPTEVARLESTFRRHLAVIARHDRTASLMFAQDRVLRFVARQMLRFDGTPSGVWNPTRGRRQWQDQADLECSEEATE
jgi:cellulose synthase/poly-beta-1,6-N-acetylglucosamine synthase-like glycosyltransferase